jgi:hypothetical protein
MWNLTPKKEIHLDCQPMIQIWITNLEKAAKTSMVNDRNCNPGCSEKSVLHEILKKTQPQDTKKCYYSLPLKEYKWVGL